MEEGGPKDEAKILSLFAVVEDCCGWDGLPNLFDPLPELGLSPPPIPPKLKPIALGALKLWAEKLNGIPLPMVVEDEGDAVVDDPLPEATALVSVRSKAFRVGVEDCRKNDGWLDCACREGED